MKTAVKIIKYLHGVAEEAELITKFHVSKGGWIMREGLDYKSDFQTGGLLERGIIELYGISVFVSLKGARIGASDVEITDCVHVFS